MKEISKHGELDSYINGEFIEDITIKFEIPISDQKNQALLYKLLLKQQINKNDKLHIKSIYFEENIDINCAEKIYIRDFSKEKIKAGTLKNLIFKKKIRIINNLPIIHSDTDYICFSDCEFTEKFIDSGLQLIPSKIDFKNCLFKDGIDINSEKETNGKVAIKNKILFMDCKLHKENKISNGVYEKIEINGGTLDGTLIFEKTNSEKIKIEGINIESSGKGEVKLNKIKNSKEIVIGSSNARSNFKMLELSKVFNTKGEGLILMYNLNITNFLYHGSTIIPKLSISGVDINNLEFSEIDLGKSMFNDLEVDRIYLDGANLSECIFNDINFKGNYQLESKELDRIQTQEKEEVKKEKISDGKLKDNYRQLKHVMDKNGNHTEANKFYALEMLYYFKTINCLKNPFLKLLLLFEAIISYFGNNFLLPIIYIIIFGILINYIEGHYFYIENSIHYNIGYINYFFSNINLFNSELIRKEGITWVIFYQKIILAILYWHLTISIKRTTKR